MKSFREYVTEAAVVISVSEAEKLLGLSGKYTAADVKKAARSAMQKAHPDKGGSVDAFNRAKAAQKKLSGGSTLGGLQGDSRTEYESKMTEARSQVVQELKNKFQIDKFTAYFTDIFKEGFTSTMKIFDSGSNRTYVHFDAVWVNANGSRRFDMGVSVDLHKVVFGPTLLGGGNPDISYTLSVDAYGYASKKKVKMSQRDWKNTNSHRVLADPKVAFPKAKVTKSQTLRKFSRRDMLLLLRNEANAITVSDFWLIPTKDNGIFVQVYRGTFNRTPYWQVNGIYEKGNMTYKKKMNAFFMVDESEATGDTFISFQKMDYRKVVKEMERIKQENQAKK